MSVHVALISRLASRGCLPQRIRETEAMMVSRTGRACFCQERSQPSVKKMVAGNAAQRERAPAELPAPKSLFRRDCLATLREVMAADDAAAFHDVIHSVSERFGADVLEWPAEGVNRFGNRRGLREECGAILASSPQNNGGACLAVLAFDYAKRPGSGRAPYHPPLERTGGWSATSIAFMHPEPGKTFRDAHRQNRKPLADLQ